MAAAVTVGAVESAVSGEIAVPVVAVLLFPATSWKPPACTCSTAAPPSPPGVADSFSAFARCTADSVTNSVVAVVSENVAPVN